MIIACKNCFAFIEYAPGIDVACPECDTQNTFQAFEPSLTTQQDELDLEQGLAVSPDDVHSEPDDAMAAWQYFDLRSEKAIGHLRFLAALGVAASGVAVTVGVAMNWNSLQGLGMAIAACGLLAGLFFLAAFPATVIAKDMVRFLAIAAAESRLIRKRLRSMDKTDQPTSTQQH